MTNQLCLVGRISEIKEVENHLIVDVIVNRSFKNINGEYDNDIIPVVITGPMTSSTKEYCQRGDLIGIRGRIERHINDENSNGYAILQIIAERVTFLSNKKAE